MRYKTKWQSVMQHANFAIDGYEVVANICDEHGFVVASIVIATVYDDDERQALYWALRRALEGEATEVMHNAD